LDKCQATSKTITSCRPPVPCHNKEQDACELGAGLKRRILSGSGVGVFAINWSQDRGEKGRVNPNNFRKTTAHEYRVLSRLSRKAVSSFVCSEIVRLEVL
jgi:hypothetical protein